MERRSRMEGSSPKEGASSSPSGSQFATQQYNMRNPSVKRILREMAEMGEEGEEGSSAGPSFVAEPLEGNIFEWVFAVRGPPDTEFEGGVYMGRILLPQEYPYKPPAFLLLTPSGRFELNTKICLSISNHHPEHWQPSWSIRTALIALIAFFPSKPDGALGSLDLSKAERRRLAAASRTAPPAVAGVSGDGGERQEKVRELYYRLARDMPPPPVDNTDSGDDGERGEEEAQRQAEDDRAGGVPPSSHTSPPPPEAGRGAQSEERQGGGFVDGKEEGGSGESPTFPQSPASPFAPPERSAPVPAPPERTPEVALSPPPPLDPQGEQASQAREPSPEQARRPSQAPASSPTPVPTEMRSGGGTWESASSSHTTHVPWTRSDVEPAATWSPGASAVATATTHGEPIHALGDPRLESAERVLNGIIWCLVAVIVGILYRKALRAAGLLFEDEEPAGGHREL